MDKVLQRQTDYLRRFGAKFIIDEIRFRVLDNLFANSELEKYSKLSFDVKDGEVDVVELVIRIKWKDLLDRMKTKKKSTP